MSVSLAYTHPLSHTSHSHVQDGKEGGAGAKDETDSAAVTTWSGAPAAAQGGAHTRTHAHTVVATAEGSDALKLLEDVARDVTGLSIAGLIRHSAEDMERDDEDMYPVPFVGNAAVHVPPMPISLGEHDPVRDYGLDEVGHTHTHACIHTCKHVLTHTHTHR